MPFSSLLDIIAVCDNANNQLPKPPHLRNAFDDELIVPLRLDATPHSPVIGLLRPIIVSQLILENEQSRAKDCPELWDLTQLSQPKPHVCFQAWLKTPAIRTAAMKELAERWRDTPPETLFADVCGPSKWRNEPYAIYKNPFGVHDYPSSTQANGDEDDSLNYAFELERSVCALFGAVTYGVHMNSYIEEQGVDGSRCLRVWVPTRARTKPTWPGFLDNTVAGGIPAGLPIFDCVVKECLEEASLQEDIVRAHVRCVGVVSYNYRTSKGWIHPEVEYTFDLPIPPNVDSEPFEPTPLDGEVESFELMTQDQILTDMRNGRFKSNSALVLIDLLVRLGYITPDNEPDYLQIVSRMHCSFDSFLNP